MDTLILKGVGVYQVIRINPESVKGFKGRFDIRKMAYELAREMLANGCLIGNGPLKCLTADAYEYRVYVNYMKKADSDLYSSPILEEEWKP